MSEGRKKRFIIADIAAVVLLSVWMASLCLYFELNMPNGALGVTTKFGIFARNYLIPAQIFGVTIAVIAVTSVLYYRLRRKKLIGIKYLLLVVFNILPFCLISMEQCSTMAYYWGWIYQK